MKKKLLIALLAIMAAVCCVFGFTACGKKEFKKVSGSEGLEYTLSDDGTYYYFSGLGTCTDTEITIANFYNDKPVKQIGKYTKYNEVMGLLEEQGEKSLFTIFGGNVTSVIISEGVTAIGVYAFADLVEMVDDGSGEVHTISYGNLKNISIPDSVTVIGAFAFQYCPFLEYNEYDNAYYLGNKKNPYAALIQAKDEDIKECTINNKTKVIGTLAFSNCYEYLTSITIPDSVIGIGDYAFSSCNELASVKLGKRVTSIGDCAFYECNLTSITIPESVTRIGESAFEQCCGLTSITIPDSITSIGSYAFIDCDLEYNEYNNAYYLGNEKNPYVVLIEAKDDDIKKCTINNKTKVIYSYAFIGCYELTSITIPDSVKSIGVGAFADCDGLMSITIPDSVTEIGYRVFEGCNGLTSLTVEEGNNVYHSYGNCLIETATKTLIAGCKSSVIPTDGRVTSIGYSAFSDCSSLTSITIPDSVTSIGYSAFSDCSSLTSITIPESVTRIGESAFEYCCGLTSITIPDSVTSIGDRVFYNSRSLTDIHFNGTKAQWNAIEKDSGWNDYTGDYTIHCTDGDISK